MGEPLWELEIGRKRRGDSHLLRSFYAATNSEKLSDASIHHFQRDKVLEACATVLLSTLLLLMVVVC
jgi:hypothetical protein